MRLRGRDRAQKGGKQTAHSSRAAGARRGAGAMNRPSWAPGWDMELLKCHARGHAGTQPTGTDAALLPLCWLDGCWPDSAIPD